MPIYYKLTDQDWFTRRGETNECLWGPNVTHKARRGKGSLCSDKYIHFYHSPELAALLNPIHANIKNPVLWECKARLALDDNGIKAGAKSLTTLQIIPLPKFSLIQHVAFAIYCAQEVYKGTAWNIWASDWLTNNNYVPTYVDDDAYVTLYDATNDSIKAAIYATNAVDAITTCAATYTSKAAAAVNASTYAANAAAKAASYASNHDAHTSFLLYHAKRALTFS